LLEEVCFNGLGGGNGLGTSSSTLETDPCLE
jgi:hypothetical protein